MSSNHMHNWLETCFVGSRQCLVCGIVVTFDHREGISMASINDWAAKAADYIYNDFVAKAHVTERELKLHGVRKGRIAAIIATFAEPLINLLKETHREHKHADVDSHECCCPQCTCDSWSDDIDVEPEANSDEPCNCGADAWNARVEETLNG